MCTRYITLLYTYDRDQIQLHLEHHHPPFSTPLFSSLEDGAGTCATYRCLRKKHSYGEEVLWEDKLSEHSASGGAEQLLLQDCTAKARTKGLFFHRHQHDARAKEADQDLYLFLSQERAV